MEPDTVIDTLTADSSAVLKLCAGFLSNRLRESQRAGVVGETVDVDEAAEVLIRIALSFVLLPDTALDLDDPDLGRRLLVPLLQDSTRTLP